MEYKGYAVNFEGCAYVVQDESLAKELLEDDYIRILVYKGKILKMLSVETMSADAVHKCANRYKEKTK